MVTTPYAGLSDLGRKRSRNDDRWGADDALRLYIVADGVGSTNRGDLAAALVVEMLPTSVERHLAGTDLRDPQAPARLGGAMVEMCNDLYARSKTDPDLASADTTVVAAVITDSRALIAHLGDSRAYLYRDRVVQRLTSDHTIVQAVIDAGELTPEQAAHHPNRSVVTRHVLMTPPAKPDVRALDLYLGDRVLLCSDGLHGVLDDATLAAILTDYPDPADACRALIGAANQAGGPDNITAVVVNADQGTPSPPPPSAPTLPDLSVSPAPAAVPPPVFPPAQPVGPLPPQLDTPPPQPPRPRPSRGLKLLLLTTVVLVLAAAAITGYVVWSRQYASQTPTGQTNTSRPQTAAPSAQNGKPTSPAGQIVLPFPGLNHPEGVTADAGGNVYVIVDEGGNARVWKLAAGSTTPSVLPFTGLKGAYDITVDTAGSVYVADSYGGGRVTQLAVGLTTPIVLPFDWTRGLTLSHPSGLAVDTFGHIYVADPSSNRVLGLATGSGDQIVLPFPGLDHPNGVAVDINGDVYVTDTGNNRVLMLAPGSTNLVQVPFSGLDHPTGIEVDAAANVYVCDSRNHRVVKMAAGSQSVLPFSDLGNPTGVTVDAAGSVYVADYDSSRVVKLPAG